ncbi:hypothetical protein DCCM_3434 [Desulfocucumis palustris]|uniref:Uncharacterized protein n=1 Tax=Desulfocucumis palustris TaxID=1898651 RepID=A0A2L2XDW8_9FIRM|nr:hypothetical protein DCCM_3434 [Desulfocucumis palustris]
MNKEYNNVVVVEGEQEKNSNEATISNFENLVTKLKPKQELISESSIQEIQEVARRNCAADLPADFIAGLLREYPPERIKEKIELIGAGAGQIRNLPGLLLAALRDNYVNIPGKPALKEKGENNNNVSRAGPKKEYRDINWQPADQKEKSSKNRRDLLDELYVR